MGLMEKRLWHVVMSTGEDLVAWVYLALCYLFSLVQAFGQCVPPVLEERCG